MAYRTSGNLAYQDNRPLRNSAQRQDSFALPRTEPVFDPRREERELERRRQEQRRRQAHLQIRSIHRALGVQRAKSLAGIVLVVAVVAVLFAFVMIRQSQIVEQNFANTRLRNQITELKTQNLEMHEELIKKTDLQAIEKQAEIKFGLRKPAQSQRIEAAQAAKDRVIVYQKDGTEEAKKNILQMITNHDEKNR